MKKVRIFGAWFSQKELEIHGIQCWCTSSRKCIEVFLLVRFWQWGAGLHEILASVFPQPSCLDPNSAGLQFYSLVTFLFQFVVLSEHITVSSHPSIPLFPPPLLSSFPFLAGLVCSGGPHLYLAICSDLSFLSFCLYGGSEPTSDDLQFFSFCFLSFAVAGPIYFY